MGLEPDQLGRATYDGDEDDDGSGGGDNDNDMVLFMIN